MNSDRGGGGGGGSSGTVINGLLPETSAARLSIIGRPEEPSEGLMVSAVRSLAEGGHATTPFEVFITVFCHYTIKAIAGTGRRAFDKDSIRRL